MKGQLLPSEVPRQVLHRGRYLLLTTITLLISFPLLHAQVTQTPGVDALGTQVNHIGNVYEITHGTQAGSNLFHSFGSFSLGSGEEALFKTITGTADGGVENILGRVTGGDPSNILGTIDSASYYPNANLFLINPAGFLFGPTATVNVGGMVALTTADYLRLGEVGSPNSGIFHTDLAQSNVLTAAPVAAFGFLGSTNPAAIRIEGSTFALAAGTGLSLIGGDISIGADPQSGISAFIAAPRGTLHLGSAASAGEILQQNLQTTANIHGDSFTVLGNITASEGATLDVSGDGGGTLKIVGGQFVADQAFLNANTNGAADGAPTAVDINMTGDVTFTNGSAISLFGGGTGRLGDTTISGHDLTFDGFSSITAINFDSPNGGGNITTTSQTVNILGGGNWFAGSFGSANSGNIGITASESLVVSGDLVNGIQSSIQNQSFGLANSGNITLATKSATIENLGFVATDSVLGQGGTIHIHGYLTPQAESLSVLSGGIIGTTGGNGSGAITINAKDITVRGTPDFTSRIQSIGFGAGGTGNILMPQTERLLVADNARINLEVEAGNLNGSSIVISASESVTLSNDAKIRMEGGGGGFLHLSSPTILIDNQSALQTIAGTVGDSTAILVKTNNLTFSGQSQINSSTVEAALGSGGPVTIQGLSGPANSVTIDGVGSGIATETHGEGTGGSVTVLANQVLLRNGASISASSTGPGNAGSIDINAGNQFTMTDSSVTTEATQSGGGAIKITTNPGGTVQLTDSMISASVLDGTGGGGSVNIDPQSVILLNSHILATAIQGAGGNIFIATNLLLLDGNSTISASSQFGQSGTITIQSPNAPISGQIHPLGKTPLLATSLLTQQCAAVANGQFSSFTVAGRDSLPTEPGSWLVSPLVMEGVSSGRVESSEWQVGDSQTLRLRQIAPAGFLTRTFAVDRSAGCQS